MEIEEQIKFQKLLKNQDMRLDSFLKPYTNRNKSRTNKIQELKINNKLSNQKLDWNVKLNFRSKLPSIIYSNEFFDCFPVRQFIYNKFWFEKYVKFNENENKYYSINKRVISKKILDF